MLHPHKKPGVCVCARLYPYSYSDLLLLIITSRLSVAWLPCQQDYRNTTDWISTIFGWMMGLRPKTTPLLFDVNLDKETNPGIYPPFI